MPMPPDETACPIVSGCFWCDNAKSRSPSLGSSRPGSATGSALALVPQWTFRGQFPGTCGIIASLGPDLFNERGQALGRRLDRAELRHRAAIKRLLVNSPIRHLDRLDPRAEVERDRLQGGLLTPLHVPRLGCGA